MKIKIIQKQIHPETPEIEYGACFRQGGNLYMRLHEGYQCKEYKDGNDSSYMAVVMSDNACWPVGAIVRLSRENCVPVQAELHIGSLKDVNIADKVIDKKW